jgi:beta-N-acetylhexosaminidase
MPALVVALAALAVWIAVPRTSAPRPARAATAATRPAIPIPSSPAKLLGQRIMVGLPGITADAALLSRIRAGRVGAVILFAPNIVSSSQVIALIGTLQRAASEGGNPPLLIATDQEGGQVKRFPNGPPSLAPPDMVHTGRPSIAGSQGRATGDYLKARGVNWDLAPVADVPTFGGAFIWRQGRAFSFNSKTVARYATPFAVGVQAAGVAATAKHFPGVGSAASDTDNGFGALHPTAAERSAALDPYRSLIPAGVDAVMLANAGFPAYDSSGAAAATSRRIIQGLLRGQLRFRGVTITDSPLANLASNEIVAGVRAAEAGADILLYTDSAAGALPALEGELASGRLSRAEAEASYARIVALKQRVAR